MTLWRSPGVGPSFRPAIERASGDHQPKRQETIMPSSHHERPLYVPPPTDERWPHARETEHRLAENVGEDERTAFGEWLRHVEAGRIGGGQ